MDRVTNDVQTIANGAVQHWSFTTWGHVHSTINHPLLARVSVQAVGVNTAGQTIATSTRVVDAVVDIDGDTQFSLASDFLSASMPRSTATITATMWLPRPLPNCPPPPHA